MATTAAAEVAAEGLRQSQLVGALLVPPRRVAAVRAALPEGWERRGRSVCAHRDPSDEGSEDEARRVAVHVSAVVLSSHPAVHSKPTSHPQDHPSPCATQIPPGFASHP